MGACIVNSGQVNLGIGYNGFPRGISDSSLPWAKASLRGDPLETKYPYVVHAEANALLNKNAASVEGAVSGGKRVAGSVCGGGPCRYTGEAVRGGVGVRERMSEGRTWEGMSKRCAGALPLLRQVGKPSASHASLPWTRCPWAAGLV